MNNEELERHREHLHKEIQNFEKEKEKIRKDIEDIRGTKFSSKELITNIVLAILIIVLLILQLFFNLLPDFISLEIATFLVSFKIILMIYSQHKHNHFMFWMLNTIEFRINLIEKSIKKINATLATDKKNTQ